MSEARKYRLNLIVANQFTTQLTEEIRDAVFGNIGTTIAFRIGQNDVDVLSRYFQPHFDADDLLRVPNRSTIVRTLIGGVPTQPFSMATIAPLGTPNKELGDALKQLSAAKYGRPRQVVEKEIFARMATLEPEPNKPGGYNANVGGGVGPGSSQAGSGSFLDQWLEKRKKLLNKPPRRPGAGNQSHNKNALDNKPIQTSDNLKKDSHLQPVYRNQGQSSHTVHKTSQNLSDSMSDSPTSHRNPKSNHNSKNDLSEKTKTNNNKNSHHKPKNDHEGVINLR